ncbi:malate synthase A [Nitrospirillum sp. BR 11164]|uniref:malate synthase A n=1 Tax=Nitrospirillum sp. BR 11164 TaxID=3104324 RepID=UPI002AFFE1A1|nr:malate synthase A [Nitrospirillum sp. BR 11164]MEA1653076.1 malate synthase A [Nitrospirillum sp. BR 11164]
MPDALLAPSAPRLSPDAPAGRIEIRAASKPGYDVLLTPAALAFVADLERRFGWRRRYLLEKRVERQARLDAGEKPAFNPACGYARHEEWTVEPQPADLRDRRVEITGPVERKMIINALNSGAQVFMADFEDSNAPTWANIMDGQVNLRDAIRRTITHIDPVSGKSYALNDKVAVLMVRPRGWHLEEKHVLIDGRPVSAALFDFGLYFFHNARELLARGSGPYFYLPKIEGRAEARLWNDVFLHAQECLDLPPGTIKATVLIESILAAFEMDEILYELRCHSAGLNCGRWDYIFSFIKKFRNDPDALLPDRAAVTMDKAFLNAYSRLAVKTCHRRGAPAIGGMAAYIPVKDDPVANDRAFAQVRADKEREARNGHDGTWVAHPALVPVARAVFDDLMPTPNQIHATCHDVRVMAEDLLAIPQGPRTEAGLRQNVAVGIGYIEAWLRGQGCVPLFNLMEDAATAEISRAQVWQWLRHGARLDDGRTVDHALVERIIEEELAAWIGRVGEVALAHSRHEEAARLFSDLVFQHRFAEFLTLPAYDRLMEAGS